jgi:voltage-gated potassium channel
MIRVLLVGFILTALTVIIHGLGTLTLSVDLVRLWAEKKDRGRPFTVELLIVRLVSGLLVLHLVEMGLWAACYVFAGLLPDVETAAYFSLTSYTTVGYGDVVLEAPTRLIGPIEAAVGVLMLGWSTGLVVVAITRLYSDRLEARIGGTARPPQQNQ